jgi:hypothetical protein
MRTGRPRAYVAPVVLRPLPVPRRFEVRPDGTSRPYHDWRRWESSVVYREVVEREDHT